MRNRYYLFFFLFLLLFSCKQDFTEKKKNSEYNAKLQEKRDFKQVFYSMNLPPEMSRLFERAGADYDPSFIHSPDDFVKYSDPVKIALNLGIYGVDMSYARLNGQYGLSMKYLQSITELTIKLNIPREHIGFPGEKALSRYSSDTLAFIARKIYNKTNSWLKQEGQNAEAALIIAGGWIESLYIATRISHDNPSNVEIAERIAAQKYSLNSLISLLSNYSDNEVITEYLRTLKVLRKTYRDFELDNEPEVPPGMIIEISVIIDDLRSDITE